MCFIHQFHANNRINPAIATIHHPAATYLHRLTTSGVPAPSMAHPWSLQKKNNTFARGPHISASKIYRSFLLEDMTNMINQHYWTILPYQAIRHYPQLKLSLSGVVPQ